MQNDNTRGSLGSKFEGFGSAPSEGLWENISASLDGKRKRKIAVWWWLGAAAALIAGVGIVLTTTITPDLQVANDSENSILNVTEDSQHQNPELNSTDNTNVFVVTSRGVERQNSLLNFRKIARENRLEKEVQFTFSSNSNNHTANGNETEKVGIEKSNGAVDQSHKNDFATGDALIDKVGDKDDPRHPVNNSKQDELPSGGNNWLVAEKLDQFPLTKLDLGYLATNLTQLIRPKPIQQRWEMGLFVTRWQGLNVPLKSQSQYELADTSVSAITANEALETINDNYEISVRRPIGVQFHIGYKLQPRLRIVSGISADYTTYQYKASLNADAAFMEATTVAVIPAKLTRIAIPIGVEYDLIKRRRFQFGTGIRLLNEFPFLETYKPSYDLNYVGPESTERNWISGYSFGVNFNLNASVYLTDKMRIQASPGVRWYGIQHAKTSLYLQKRDFWVGGAIGMIWDL